MIYDIYAKENGDKPYDMWVRRLRDKRAERRLDQSLKKVVMGNTSNVKPIKTNTELFEITLDHGPGLRIYCAKLDPDRFVVLNGGIKDDQQKDIEKTVEYLEDYKERLPKEK
jgi:putative addiction module killer protein